MGIRRLEPLGVFFHGIRGIKKARILPRASPIIVVVVQCVPSEKTSAPKLHTCANPFGTWKGSTQHHRTHTPHTMCLRAHSISQHIRTPTLRHTSTTARCALAHPRTRRALCTNSNNTAVLDRLVSCSKQSNNIVTQLGLKIFPDFISQQEHDHLVVRVRVQNVRMRVLDACARACVCVCVVC